MKGFNNQITQELNIKNYLLINKFHLIIKEYMYLIIYKIIIIILKNILLMIIQMNVLKVYLI